MYFEETEAVFCVLPWKIVFNCRVTKCPLHLSKLTETKVCVDPHEAVEWMAFLRSPSCHFAVWGQGQQKRENQCLVSQ